MTSAPPPRPVAPQGQRPRLFSTGKERARLIKVVNARPAGLADLYHLLLRTSWLALAAGASALFVVINALFGLGYYLVGGVENTTSYLDHFFFSVQTFGTIGYGYMYPKGRAAEWLMVAESLSSLVLNAVLTGLAFAKFARPRARVLWTHTAVVADREGVPTLMFRVANERRNHVVEATMRAALLRNEVTKEGEFLRRVVDLPLVRSSTPTFILTWTLMHQITPESPLYGVGPAELAQRQVEIVLTLTGLDDTLGQTIHARTSFLPHEVAFGARFADIISNGVLDYARFHDVVPATLTHEAMGLAPPP